LPDARARLPSCETSQPRTPEALDVLQATLPIINKLGLHARAAAKFIDVTSAYGAKIRVRLGSRAADGKSIMGVMMLGARMGTSIDVEIDGEDEAAMLEALTALLANRFGEGE
jgi:phosphocarrier protein